MRNQSKRYLPDIARLTGLTIFLVVAGHLVTGQDINTPGLEWYKFLKRYIYSFHMPLFMFISGFLFYYSLPKITNNKSYFKYVKKKLIRLLPSFVVFSLLVFVVKIVVSKYLVVDNAVSNYKDYFKVFYNPVYSFAGFLWYIYVLFQFYIVFPLLLKYLKPTWILLLSFPLYFLEITDLFAIDFFFKFLFFFSLGTVLSNNYEKYKVLLQSYKWYFLTLFVVLSILFYFIPIPKLIMGISAVFGLHALVLIINPSKFKILATLGAYSFSIYLMNTLVMGFVKALGFKFLKISYSNFFLIAILMVFLGLIIPVLIKKNIINKIPKVGKYIG